MKPSDTKGFWGSVSPHTLPVSEEKDSYRGHTFLTRSKSPLVDAYISIAQSIRNEYQRVPTPAGNPSKGPKFISVTMCEYENEPGLTSSKQTKGRRWACNTCFSLCVPVWSDGPVPEREEIEQEWADWAAKQKENGQPAKVRKMMRIRA